MIACDLVVTLNVNAAHGLMDRGVGSSVSRFNTTSIRRRLLCFCELVGLDHFARTWNGKKNPISSCESSTRIYLPAKILHFRFPTLQHLLKKWAQYFSLPLSFVYIVYLYENHGITRSAMNYIIRFTFHWPGKPTMRYDLSSILCHRFIELIVRDHHYWRSVVIFSVG